MPSSMVKKAVVRNGYKLLAWALTVLVERGQYNVAAIIILALCMLRRYPEEENNGVLSVLTNFKLHRVADPELMYAIGDWMHIFPGNHDKIVATLATTRWYDQCVGGHFYSRPDFDRLQPMLWRDDGVWYFSGARLSLAGNAPGAKDLCDAAGSQREQCLRETRIIRHHDAKDGVAILSKQMGRYGWGTVSATPVGNGYFEYRIPADTILHRFGEKLDGRRLRDVLEYDQWYDYYLQPTTEPDLVEPQTPAQLEAERRHNEMFGAMCCEATRRNQLE